MARSQTVVKLFTKKEVKKGRQDKKFSSNNKQSKLYKKKYKGQGK